MICDCGACREIEPEALARRVGWSVTLRELPGGEDNEQIASVSRCDPWPSREQTAHLMLAPIRRPTNLTRAWPLFLVVSCLILTTLAITVASLVLIAGAALSGRGERVVGPTKAVVVFIPSSR